MKRLSRCLLPGLLALPVAAFAQVPGSDGYAYQGQTYNNQAQTYGGGGYAAPAAGAYGTTAGNGYATQAAPTSAQGELFMQLQQLQSEVARLQGQLEEQQYELQRLKKEGLERYQDVDSRLTALSQQAQAAPPAAAGGGSINAAADPVPPSASAGDPEKEKLLYDASFDLVKNRDFAKADQAFGAFLRKYPNSQYAGNAQYWLGEVKLAQNDLPASATAFNQVIDKYPQSQKVADAMYKLADVERRQGNKDRARQLLQQVTSQYPKSSAAQLAQRELSRQ